jgi:starch-binding outer membrane protein, SusD/RagB family
LRQKYFLNDIDAFEGSDGAQKILRPIPQAALDLNKAEIEQNPGY